MEPEILLSAVNQIDMLKDLFIGSILKRGGTTLISKKVEFSWAELKERVEAASSSYSTTGNFLQCIYSVLVAKNHQKFRSTCLVHKFFLTGVLLTILIVVIGQLYWRQILCGCFRSLWLWPLIADMKRYKE